MYGRDEKNVQQNGSVFLSAPLRHLPRRVVAAGARRRDGSHAGRGDGVRAGETEVTRGEETEAARKETEATRSEETETAQDEDTIDIDALSRELKSLEEEYEYPDFSGDL